MKKIIDFILRHEDKALHALIVFFLFMVFTAFINPFIGAFIALMTAVLKERMDYQTYGKDLSKAEWTKLLRGDLLADAIGFFVAVICYGRLV